MEIVATADRPDLKDEADAAFSQTWPEFIFHADVPSRYLGRVGGYFPQYNILAVDHGVVVAGGWGVPLAWQCVAADLPDGYDDALVRSVEGHEAGRQPTALCLMAVAVALAERKRGLAAVAVAELCRLADEHGLQQVIAPLRPTWKHRYPTFSMAEYATWVRQDGLSVDPWIRTHQRMGARILVPAPRSTVVKGSVADWEDWTGMTFPVTGDYVVPGALNLVRIDRDQDRGCYVEENLWVQHR